MVASHGIAAMASACLVVVLAAGVAAVRTEPRLEPELAATMGDLQRHSHKLMLAIDAENGPLAAFYHHELEEVVEQLLVLHPDHDGIPVAALVEELLVPQVTRLGDTLGAGDWDETRGALDALVAGCNHCHVTAGHAFIRVAVTRENPFNQSFSE